MVDTAITDAVVYPQDQGTGVTSADADYKAAAADGLLAKNKGGEYIANGLDLSVDTVADTVSVAAGHAFIAEGGNTIHTGAASTYDKTLPAGSDSVYTVVLPTAVTGLGLGVDVRNDVWLAVDPTANDSVYIRHGSGLAEPTDPSIRLGTAHTGTGATTPGIEYQERVRVADFGAVGDGITDDTAAIQAAVDSIDHKGVLAFDGGKKYRITGTITANARNVRKIEGNNAYLINDAAVATPSLHLIGNITTDAKASPDTGNNQADSREEFKTLIEGLQVTTPTTNNYHSTGIRVENTHSTEISDCFVWGYQHNIEFVGRNRNAIIADCNIWDCSGNGIFVNSGDFHQFLIDSCHISYALNCIMVDGLNGSFDNLHITGCDIEHNATGAVANGAAPSLVTCRDLDLGAILVTGCTLQDHNTLSSNGALLRFINAGRTNVVTGCNINNSTGDGIHVESTPRVLIAGNLIHRVPNGVYITGTGATDVTNVSSNLFWSCTTACNVAGATDLRNFMCNSNVMNQCTNGVDAVAGSITGFSVNSNQAHGHYGRFINLESTAAQIIDGTVCNNSMNSDTTLSAANLIRVAKTAGAGVNAMWNITITGNNVRGRSGATEGMVVDGQGDERGLIIKNNMVRHQGTGVAFRLPAASTVVAVADNLNTA